MRVLVGLAIFIGLVLIAPASAEKARGPYDRVAKGKPPAKDSKVYTNEDLAKLFGIVEEADPEAPATEPRPETPTDKPEAQAKPDPLAWLQQRQAAQQEHRLAVEEAEKALLAARQRVTDLERQVLATRNPFSARPTLSDEEKKQRSENRETAAERNERTRKMLEEAREAVRTAESELARVRAGRP